MVRKIFPWARSILIRLVPEGDQVSSPKVRIGRDIDIKCIYLCLCFWPGADLDWNSRVGTKKGGSSGGPPGNFFFKIDAYISILRHSVA